MSKSKAIAWSAAYAALFQLQIEVWDGLYAKYGFSMPLPSQSPGAVASESDLFAKWTFHQRSANVCFRGTTCQRSTSDMRRIPVGQLWAGTGLAASGIEKAIADIQPSASEVSN